jgi:hypothetical protein
MGIQERTVLPRRTPLTALPGARRTPVDWRRYSKQVRHARRRLPRYEHPVAVSLAVSLVFAVAGLSLLQVVGVGIGAGMQQLASAVVATIPQPREVDLVLNETQVSVSAAPVFEGVPEVTRSNAVTVAGRVPAFASRADRAVALSLNGGAIGTLPIGSDGRFGPLAITVPDGVSTLTATLLDGLAEVASTAMTVLVDRTPPPLAIARPKAAEVVEGPDVIVEGKTEPGADVTVNGLAVRPNPDGTFSERLTAAAGPLQLTIVAKDRAGNETKTALAITVKASSQTQTSGTALALTLDRTKVRPGEAVIAKIVATEAGKPKADLSVTLQVGVITIGSYRTDASGAVNVGFAAPNHEVDDVAIVILGGGTSARATLTVSTK